MRRFTCICAIVFFAVLAGDGQSIGSHLDSVGEALAPYGHIKARSCHDVEIELSGPWGDYGIPAGINQQSPGELKWGVVKVDVRRVFVDLADLDEDKVINDGLFSMEYISKHQSGTKYASDTPAVFIQTRGLNKTLTVQAVDLNKIKTLRGKEGSTEAQMGLVTELRKYAIFLFADQEHADAFERSLKKAIIVCKAQ